MLGLMTSLAGCAWTPLCLVRHTSDPSTTAEITHNYGGCGAGREFGHTEVIISAGAKNTVSPQIRETTGTVDVMVIQRFER